MTVSTTSIRRETVGDGSKTNFTFDFKLISADHLQVWVDGVQLTSGWSIASTVPAVGGSIDFTSAPADGAEILIIRQLPLTQIKSLPIVGQIPSTTLEGMSDTSTMQIQQLAEQLDRVAVLPVTSTLESLEFPEPGAGELIRWNDDGTALETVDPDDILIGGTLPDPSDGDILGWSGTDLVNITIADLATDVADEINSALGDVVGPSSATAHTIAFYDGTTGKLLKASLGIGSSGQKLTSNGAGVMPSWQSDSTSITPSELSKGKVQTVASGSNLTIMMSNGVLVAGGLAVYSSRGINNGYVPMGQVEFDPLHPPPAGETIVDWAANQGNLYVVLSNGWAYAAGQNGAGQLGQGDTTARYMLTRIEYFVTNSHTITGVYCTAGSPSVTIDSVFWVTSANKIYACGYNTNGQLGDASTTSRSTPVLSYNAGANTIVDLQSVWSTVGYSGLILSDGSFRACGYNGNGQLGDGTTTQRTSWTSIGGISNAIAMRLLQTTGAGNSAVVTSDSSGSLFVWGANAYYQGANGGTANKTAPGTALITAVNSSYFGFIGGSTTIGCYCLLDNGDLYTWGYNGNDSLFKSDSGTDVTTQQTPAKLCNQTISKVWGFNASSGAVTGMIYALDVDNNLLFTGGAAMEPYCAFATTLHASYTTGVYKCAIPVEIFQGDDTISDFVIHAKGSGLVHNVFILTAAGSLYGCGYGSDYTLTNWQSQISQPSRIFNHRLNRYMWGV